VDQANNNEEIDTDNVNKDEKVIKTSTVGIESQNLERVYSIDKNKIDEIDIYKNKIE
jgi:hypothetical protein